ncbi:MAG TPA: hypothetical protein PLH57_00210 [Oligoflexia bacterium]|nr:hypothetical protein [Oligoflexia bacterium]
MGKQGAPEQKKPEGTEKKEAPKGAPHAGGAPSAAPMGGPSKGAGAKIGCLAQGCKDKDSRFNFCEEHFRQFKFGLITKTGLPVMDYEKKLEHYQKWLRAQKVA